jgi:dienelactone hydrolase
MFSKRRFVAAKVIVACVLVSVAPAFKAQGQEDRLFIPTGPHSIGVTSRQWLDEAREEIFTKDTTDKRTVWVWIWYPAEVNENAVPAPYLPEEIDIGQAIEGAVAWFDGDASATIDALSQIHLNAVQDADVSGAQEAYPVIIYSTGVGSLPTVHSFQAEELASHGYIVVTIVHTLGYGLRFPGPPYFYVGDAAFESMPPLIEFSGEDVFSVLDQLEALNSVSSGDALAGYLDLDHVGIAGQSNGAVYALWTIKRDDRLKAAVIEDGCPYEDVVSAYREVEQPVLFMVAERPECLDFYRLISGPAYLMEVEGFKHSTYLDQILWPKEDPRPDMFGTVEPARAVQITNAYVLAFFNQYLKSEHQPLLDGPSEDYPEVTVESRNAD